MSTEPEDTFDAPVINKSYIFQTEIDFKEMNVELVTESSGTKLLRFSADMMQRFLPWCV